MKYSIKYRYKTGNSFGSHEEEEYLEMQWENLEIAKANLQRIKEHYKWYQYVAEPLWAEKEVPKPEWHQLVEDTDSCAHYQIVLLSDQGRTWQFWAPWCGYFERLLSAEIVSDMKIEF